jgi:predicted anti-sigma-YlaC factor YlaD
MTCERYEDDLALHVEGDLEASAAVRLERHLAGCDRCRTFLHELQHSQRAVKALAEEPVPEEALRRVRSRVEGAISLQSRPRAAFSPAWGWALAASVALAVTGAAVAWRLRSVRLPPAIETAQAQPSSPVPDLRTPPSARPAETELAPRFAPTRPTVGTSGAVSGVEEQAMTAQEAQLSPDEADQLARAVVAVSQIASLSDLLRREEAKDEPSSGRFARLATDDPDVVIYWQLDANGE